MEKERGKEEKAEGHMGGEEEGGFPTKLKTQLHPPRLSMHQYVFVSPLSHVQRTHRNTWPVSHCEPPPLTHPATQNKTKQVLSPEQPNVNPPASALHSPYPALHKKGSQDGRTDGEGS